MLGSAGYQHSLLPLRSRADDEQITLCTQLPLWDEMWWDDGLQHSQPVLDGVGEPTIFTPVRGAAAWDAVAVGDRRGKVQLWLLPSHWLLRYVGLMISNQRSEVHPPEPQVETGSQAPREGRREGIGCVGHQRWGSH